MACSTGPVYLFSPSPTCAAHVAERQSDPYPDSFPSLQGTGNSIASPARAGVTLEAGAGGGLELKKPLGRCCELSSKLKITPGSQSLLKLSQGAPELSVIPRCVPLPMSSLPSSSLFPRPSANLPFVIDFI